MGSVTCISTVSCDFDHPVCIPKFLFCKLQIKGNGINSLLRDPLGQLTMAVVRTWESVRAVV